MNKPKDHKFMSQRGFSLAEVMVAAGMLGVVSLGLMQITKNSNTAMKTVAQGGNMLELLQETRRALTDQDSCTVTMAGKSVAALPTNASPLLFQYNKNTGTPTTREVLAIGQRYGTGPETVVVRSIELTNWTETDVDTSPGINERYGTADVVVVFAKGSVDVDSRAGLSDAEKAAIAKQSSYGSFLTTKTVEVQLIADATSNQVKRCSANEGQFLQAACAMMQGTYHGGFCKDIQIDEHALDDATNTKYAVESNGHMRANRGLVVASKTGTNSKADSVVPEEGSAFIQNDLSVMGSLGVGIETLDATHLTSKLLVDQGKALFTWGTSIFDVNTTTGTNNQVFINPDAGTGVRVREGANNSFEVLTNGSSRIKAYSDAGVENFSLGTDGEMILTTGGVARFNVKATGETIVKNAGGNNLFRVTDTGNVEVGQGGNVRITLNNNGELSLKEGGTSFITIGQGAGGGYRPIVIHNQPINADFSGAAGQEVPTKAWVKNMVYGTVYDQAKVNQILSDLANYAQHHTIEALKKIHCDNTRVKNADSGFATCTFSGTTCSCTPTSCTSSTGGAAGAHCNDIYARGTLYSSRGNFSGPVDISGALTVTNRVTASTGFFCSGGSSCRTATANEFIGNVNCGSGHMGGIRNGQGWCTATSVIKQGHN
jgi:type II secretory pathway pseudopilin PulG